MFMGEGISLTQLSLSLPPHVSAMQLRARAHLDLGQLEAASQDYMLAVKLDPGDLARPLGGVGGVWSWLWWL